MTVKLDNKILKVGLMAFILCIYLMPGQAEMIAIISDPYRVGSIG